MGKLKILGLFTGMVVIFSIFQNCSKESTSGDEVSVSYSRTPASTFSKMSVDESVLAEGTVGITKSRSTSDPRIFEIDILKATVYVRLRDQESAGEMFALDEADKKDLQAVLSNAEICEPEVPERSEDIACTMIYSYPYVEITDGLEVKRLGEILSGCDVPVDFCDDKSSEVKEIFKNIIDKISSSPF